MTKNTAALNRTLFIADNRNLLEHLDNESIDLICIDPPFAKNQTWVGALRPPLSDEERDLELATLADWEIRNRAEAADAGIEWPDCENGAAKFQDIWRWEDDVHEEWLDRIKSEYKPLNRVIKATRHTHGEDTAAYLTYMAIRLVEMHRVLKPTGSIFLHCDYSANSYLRLVMDSLFGRANFRNEIVWRRNDVGKGSQHTPKSFGTNTDTILYYSKSADTRVRPYRDLTEEEASSRFDKIDEHGRKYNTATPLFSSRSMGARPNLCYEWRGFRNPHPSGWRLSKERLEEEYQKGNVVIRPDGKLERRKYIDDYLGVPIDNLWSDIPRIGSAANERTGYPTQKPAALAERIIKVATNPGDIVLDCFAGCAYVPVAAERNGRQWIACDISPRSLTVLRRQFAKFRYAVNGERQGDEPPLIADADITVRSPKDLPLRTDKDPEPAIRTKPLSPRKFKVPSSIIPEKEMLEFLLELSGYMAWCCGFANRMPDGRIVRTTKNFHLDHISPKSKEGTSNHITNRAPMCTSHNIRKSNRGVLLADYRQEIADAGEMMVNTTDELVDLSMAYEAALNRHSVESAKRGVRGKRGNTSTK